MRLRLAPRILAVCILFLSPNARAQLQPGGVPACTATGPQHQNKTNTGFQLAPALTYTRDDRLQPGMVLSVNF